MAKVRGRRSNKKDKDEYFENSEKVHGFHDAESDADNQKNDDNYNGSDNDTNTKDQDSNTTNKSSQDPSMFFGLIDHNELNYFHQAEQTLNLDTFGSPEEKALFVDSVFQEARGKELKLVTNKICSKLMERLILTSTLKQIQQIFNAFNGRFFELSKQRYSSHVVETFLVKCASLIEKEILSNGSFEENEGENSEDEENEDEAWVSMENMFLFIVGDFKKNLKNMMVDKYASHVLRLTLLVMTGKELPSSVQSNSILRSKKSKIARKVIDIKDSEDYEKKFQVPSSFKDDLREVLKEITTGETTETLRELAIEPVASPVIQLLIQLEGIVDKDRTIWKMIFNGDDENADVKQREKEGAFVEYLLSDSIGSHFLQNAIENQKVKAVERIYQQYMKDRIVKLAKRENTGIYVVEKMMEKLKSKQQVEILDKLIPILNELIVNNLDVGGSIIDCSIKNDNYKKDEIISAFVDFFNKGSKEEELFENILKLNTSTLYSKKDDWPTSEERRRALFLEKLIDYDSDHILKLCVENLLNFENDVLIKFCKHGVFSHIVESVLDKRDLLTIIERKTILNKLVRFNNIVELACNATGSHIVDKLWMFTVKLNMFKERIARTLFDNSEDIKITIYGRMVWKNWRMEAYSRKFNDWKWEIKEEEKEYDEKIKQRAIELELQKQEETASEEVGGDRKRGRNQYEDKDEDDKSKKNKRGRGRAHGRRR